MTDSTQPRLNRLLAALPKTEQDRLLPPLTLVTLGFEEVLFEPDEWFPHVYFSTEGIISLLLDFEDGLTAEIGRVNNEARRPGPLANLLLRYTQRCMHSVSQLAACNNRHSIDQRLCRWLLITNDRVQGD